MKRLMPALAAALVALPDIGCYECQERKALGTVVFMR